MSEKPKGPYTLWYDLGVEGWHFRDFTTLAEALRYHDHYGIGWVIQKAIKYEVKEVETGD